MDHGPGKGKSLGGDLKKTTQSLIGTTFVALLFAFCVAVLSLICRSCFGRTGSSGHQSVVALWLRLEGGEQYRVAIDLCETAESDNALHIR